MKRFKNILYVAESGVIVKAFHHAVHLAETNNARLTLLMVMEPIPRYLNRLTPRMLKQARIRETEEALERLREWVANRLEVEPRVVEGDVFLEVIREVLRNERDLVVKSAEGSDSALRWLFGTTDMHLLRKCPCPVWLFNSSEPTPIRRIMAAVDFNELDPSDGDSAEPLNRMILEMSGSLAHREQSEHHVVHAWKALGEYFMTSGRAGLNEEEVMSYLNEVQSKHRNWLDHLLDKGAEWLGPEIYDAIKPKTHLTAGHARHIIPNLARELKIDLIVMGTVARTGIPGLIIGNTAEAILNEIDCSVLAVKPPGFVSPVTLGD